MNSEMVNLSVNRNVEYSSHRIEMAFLTSASLENNTFELTLVNIRLA